MRSMSSLRAVSMRMGVSPAPSHLARDLDAVPPGQHQVEHDEVGVDAVVLSQRLLAVARLDDVVASLLEVETHELDDVAFVVDDEDRLHGRQDSPAPSACGEARVSAM